LLFDAATLTRSTNSLGSLTLNCIFCCLRDCDVVVWREFCVACGMSKNFFNESGDRQPTRFRSFANATSKRSRNIKTDYFFIGGVLVRHDEKISTLGYYNLTTIIFNGVITYPSLFY